MNNAKNRVVVGLSLCFIFLLSVAFTAYCYMPDNRVSHSGVAVSQTSLYIVKEYEGKIAIYKTGEENPTQVLDDPYISNLPQADQQRLHEGIPVFTDDELTALIEDYTS